MQKLLVIIGLFFTCDLLANELNTFSMFAGKWTLKADNFEQVWDGKTIEKIKIPNHNTKCDFINTKQSILCVVDAGSLKGHIFWTYDTHKNQVHHLSHFGEARNGVGVGVIGEFGNLTSRVSFQGEPEGSYRIYKYIWVNKNEYSMKSTQFNLDGTPTGNWYGGVFVRK
jgi:hypothetical protein